MFSSFLPMRRSQLIPLLLALSILLSNLTPASAITPRLDRPDSPLAQSDPAQDGERAPLRITSTQPSDGTQDVSPSSQIVVVFNRPVVALTSTDQPAPLPDFNIEPATEVSASWLNTSILVIKPLSNWGGGQTFTVNIPPVSAASGAGITEPHSFSFTTARPEVINAQPTGELIAPDAAIRVSFSQPMAVATVVQAFSLINEGDATAVAGTSAWDEIDNTFIFTPTEKLYFGGRYTIRLSEEARDASGQGPLRQAYESPFTVAPLPNIEQTYPQQGETGLLPDGQVTIRFNTNMSSTSVLDNLRISPLLTSTSVYSYYTEWDRQLIISWFGEPGTQYEVTVGQETADQYGNTLGEDFVLSYTTGDFSPFVRLDLAQFSHFSAYTDTRASLLFRNVADFQVSLYRLSLSELYRITGENSWEVWQTYQAPDPNSNLIWSRNYEGADERNVTVRQVITLTDESGERLPPGLYLIESGKPTDVPTPQGEMVQQDRQRAIIALSNHNLVVKKSEQGDSLAWITNLQTGAPVADQPVRFVHNGKTVGTGETGEDGIALDELEIPFNNSWLPLLAVSGEPGDPNFAIAASDWNSGVAIWDFNLGGGNSNDPYVMHFYTDRPIYRPGQTVYWKGIIRRVANDQYRLPDESTEIRMVVHTPRGNRLMESTVTPGEYGTVSGEIKLADEAETGYYFFETTIQLSPERTIYGSTSWQVASYRKPEFEISLTPEKPSVVQGETIKLTANARYFSGGAIANAPVTWQLLASQYSFAWNDAPEGRWFSFDPYDPENVEFDPYGGFSGGLIKEGSGTTDSAGNFTIEVPADLGDALQSQNWYFNATIQSSTNQFVTANTTLPVHRGQYYIGLSPTSYVATSGEENTVDLVTVTPDGKPYADEEVNVVIYEFRWNSVSEKTGADTYIWKTSVERTPVYSTSVTTGADGFAKIVWTPAAGGQYQITASGEDEDGNLINSATFVWVSSANPSDYVAWPQRNNDRIELVADKKLYQLGDTAKILVPNPFSGTVTALLTLERAGVMESRVVELAGNSNTIEIPIEERLIPNVYVNVVLVRPIDEANPIPLMRVGYTMLTVANTAKALNVEVAASAETVHPGDTVTYTLTVRDAEGNPAPNSEVSMALVDKAVLSLAVGDTRSLLDIFYYQRSLSVSTGATLVINRDRLSQQLSEGQKGGGGGGDGGLIEVRQEFPDIAYWRANLVSDEDGKIEVSVTLPDNLTTWTLTARAVNAKTQLGEATLDLIASKELQVRPLLPRFFTAGDQATIGGVVVNASTADIQDIAFSAEIEIIDDGGSQVSSLDRDAFDLTANAQQRFDFPVEIPTTASRFVLTMTAQSKGFADAVRIELPVQRYITPETVATAGTVPAEGRSEEIQFPKDATDGGELLVNLEASLASGMIDGLTYLEHYPYECNEQSTSRFLPNIFTVRALRALNIDNQDLENRLNFQLGIGVQKLLNRQNPDGGWGYWSQEESAPFITAYVLWGLHNAKEMGYPIETTPLNRAADYLDRSFQAPGRVEQNWRLNEMAFVHFVLAEMGAGDPGRVSTLFDERARMDHYGKAYLALAMADYNNSGDGTFEEAINTLVADLIGAAQVTATTTHWQEGKVDWWTFNSDTRSTAIVLAALVRLRPDEALLPGAVRWLMQARTLDRWSTTQETAWSIIGLTDWLEASGELEADYDWQVSLNDEEIGAGAIDASNLRAKVQLRQDVADLLQNEANTLRLSRSNDSGELYYTVALRYYLDASTVEARDHGIVVDRSFALEGQPVAQAQVGDVISVTVTIIAPTSLYHVLVEAPIPAGTEPVDRNLQTEPLGIGDDGQPILRSVGSAGDAPWFYWVPSHIDVRDDKVALFATYLPAGTYQYSFQVRATVAGEYRVLPAHAEMMYFSEVWGRSSGAEFVVTEE